MSIIEEQVSHAASAISRGILKAKLDLLLLSIQQVAQFDEVAIIVPQAVYDVHFDLAEEPDLNELTAVGMVHMLQKYITDLSELTAIHLAKLSNQSTINTQESTMSNFKKEGATTVSFVETVSVTQPSTTESSNAMNESTNTTTEQETVSATAAPAGNGTVNDAARAKKQAAARKGFRTAGEVTAMVAIVGGAVVAVNYARPIIIAKILEVTGLATPAVAAEVVVAEVAEMSGAAVASAEGAAGFLGGSVQVGSIAVPEAALAAAAVIAVAAVGYAGYKYYKGRQAKKASAVGTEKPATTEEAEAKIEAAVEAVEDSSLKSFLKGLLAGAKQSVASIKMLAYINVAFILAAVAAGAGYPIIASLVYAAVGIYLAIAIAAIVVSAMALMVGGAMLAGTFGVPKETAEAA